MHILKREAIEVISQRLRLPVTGVEQDWDVELANSSRIDEFLTVFKQDTSLTVDQKYALMALILASYQDALREGEPLNDGWDYMKETLKNDSSYHGLVDYWSLPNERNEDDLFEITPHIRSLA